ncbi:MAG: CBS domain-containing protein [Kiloniellaceae bacterium]
MNVATLLKAKGSRVVTTRPEITIQTIIRRMKLEGIGAVVVVDSADDRIVGIISERDIARALTEHGADLLRMRVADIMTRSVRTCAPHDGIKHVMTVMTRSRIRHLPVIDERRLCGIISIGDVVKYRLEEMELEANVLRDAYITCRSAVAS